jgi:hypothetical protein
MKEYRGLDMDTLEVFKKGKPFKDFIEGADSENIDEAIEILEKLIFQEETIDRIKDTKEEIFIIVCAEMWCSDCRANLPVLEKIKEYNSLIRHSIVKKDGYETFFKKYISDELKIPTFIMCDSNFNVLGTFVERPEKVKEIISNKANMEYELYKKEIIKYKNGYFGDNVVKELLDIIERVSP